jgi:hypothetical protein
MLAALSSRLDPSYNAAMTFLFCLYTAASLRIDLNMESEKTAQVNISRGISIVLIISESLRHQVNLASSNAGNFSSCYRSERSHPGH